MVTDKKLWAKILNEVNIKEDYILVLDLFLALFTYLLSFLNII